MSFRLSKILPILFLFISLQWSWSQSPTTYFDENKPNVKYLEHLIKKGIDEVRVEKGLNPLVNDSILYLASADHAQFLKQYGRLSHYQSQNKEKRTPQLRAELYGAVNYNVGENVASISYGASSETYGSIAKSFVTNWVNSPGHYQNIITPDYEITGVSVSLHNEKKAIFACQKFAKVDFRFVFEESSTFFPYSNYAPPQQINSFDEVPQGLIPKYKYPYKLRHDKLEVCASCPDKHKESPDISLAYDERKGFVLRVENSAYVNKLIRNKWDGFAVELVDYEDYACGSPFYYEKPSRRNGQLRLNGMLLEPKFRKDLERGFRKRKANKEVKFFPYIFRKDSVKFFKRFGQYRLDKYTSEYFEIRLGKPPRNSPRFFNHNLIVIKDKQICDVYYFTDYCGEVYEEYKSTDFIPFQPDTVDYLFQISPDQLSFSIPFQQGRYNFEKETVLKNISTLSEYDFIIDSVKIKAFSSVEGDSAINAQLQIKRGENIADIFQGIQEKEIEKSISTAINWTDFRRAIRRNHETRPLSQLNNKELLKEVNRNSTQLEPQLAASRKGDVMVYFHVIPNLKSLKYYIKKEFIRLNEDILQKHKSRINYESELNSMADLYKYVYAMIQKDYLQPDIFLAMEPPSVMELNPRLVQYYLLFGKEYPEVFSTFDNYEENSSYYLKNYKNSTKIDFIPEFNYWMLKMISEELIERKKLTQQQLEVLKPRAIQLKSYYEDFEMAKKNIDKVNFNLNMLALNHHFNSNPEGEQKNAIMALSQVHQYYVENELLNDSLMLHLARMAIFYQNPELALNMVMPFHNTNDEIRAFVNEVAYQHKTTPFSEVYYQKLIDDSKILPPEIWCNMFIKPCGIPFQVFDHEALRKLYCSQCKGKNDYLNGIYYGDE